ncbi:MAG TPA: hypothetical protein VNV35_21600 [Puia sp.]|jgi:hypothetical protein|nr:hypothetical protein [Puia sp.]
MEVPALQSDLNNSFGLDLPETATIEMLEGVLAERINTMITADFNRLISLLYRVDVSETKLKQLLRESAGTDAGLLIARLVLERQWQKIETRRKYR